MAFQAKTNQTINNDLSSLTEPFYKNGSQRYKIDNLTYPLDLVGTDAYGGNYVVFYINVNADSKLLKQNGGTAEIVEDSDRIRYRSRIAEENLSKEAAVAASVGEVAVKGSIAGFGVAGASRPGEGESGLTSLTKILGGGAKGAAVAAGAGSVAASSVTSVAASTSRSQKTLKSAIALHIPNQLNIRYGTSWSDEDTAMGLMALGLGSNVADGVTSIINSVTKASGMGSTIQKNGGSSVGEITSAAALSGAVPGMNTGLLSSATGLAYNPRKEQVFKGVDFRTFAFEYDFFPRNSTESKSVLNIIKMFKLHMHPEFKDASRFLYVYPSEFDIQYFTNGIENKAIHKHPSCVLTELTVNYTPNGGFHTFEDGTPTQIKMILTFRELLQMDKDLIDKGM